MQAYRQSVGEARDKKNILGRYTKIELIVAWKRHV